MPKRLSRVQSVQRRVAKLYVASLKGTGLSRHTYPRRHPRPSRAVNSETFARSYAAYTVRRNRILGKFPRYFP